MFFVRPGLYIKQRPSHIQRAYTTTPTALVPKPPLLLAGPPFPPTTAQCQPCCPRCNSIKGTYSLDDTLDHLRTILAHAATPAFQAQFGAAHVLRLLPPRRRRRRRT